MPRTGNETNRQEMADNIKTIARAHMRTNGTAGLSLRAVARELGITAPAIYNYFPNLDALITALIIDAFSGLGDAVQAAAETTAPDTAARLRAAAHTYRDWALAHPADFQLIYGNPIPGYVAPAAITVPLARRPLETFYRLLLTAYQSGSLTIPPAYAAVPPSIAQHVGEYLYAEFPELRDTPLALFYLMALLWSRLHGIVMLELFEHIGPTIGDVNAFYTAEIDAFLRLTGLSSPPAQKRD